MLKRAVTSICDLFELTDYEYIKAEFGPWPFRFSVTVIEPNRRWNWKRGIFPWRLRCALQDVIRSWMWRTCTKCGRRFTLRELCAGCRQSNLIHFQSGSIRHRDCTMAKEQSR